MWSGLKRAYYNCIIYKDGQNISIKNIKYVIGAYTRGGANECLALPFLKLAPLFSLYRIFLYLINIVSIRYTFKYFSNYYLTN